MQAVALKALHAQYERPYEAKRAVKAAAAKSSEFDPRKVSLDAYYADLADKNWRETGERRSLEELGGGPKFDFPTPRGKAEEFEKKLDAVLRIKDASQRAVEEYQSVPSAIESLARTASIEGVPANADPIQASQDKVDHLLVDYGKLSIDREDALASLRAWFLIMDRDTLGAETDLVTAVRPEEEEEHMSGMNDAVKITSEQHTKLQEKHNDLLKYHKQAMAKNDEAIDRAQARNVAKIGRLEDKLREARERIKSLEDESKEKEDQLAQLDVRCTTLKRMLDDKSRQLDEVSKKSARMVQEELARLQAQADQEASWRSREAEEKASITTEDGMTLTPEQAKSQVAALRQHIRSLNDQLAQTKGQLDKGTVPRIQELEGHIRALQQDLIQAVKQRTIAQSSMRDAHKAAGESLLQYEDSMDTITIKYDDRIAKLVEDHKAEIAGMRDDHIKAMHAMQNKLLVAVEPIGQTAVVERIEESNTQLITDLHDELATLRRKHREEIQRIRASAAVSETKHAEELSRMATAVSARTKTTKVVNTLMEASRRSRGGLSRSSSVVSNDNSPLASPHGLHHSASAAAALSIGGVGAGLSGGGSNPNLAATADASLAYGSEVVSRLEYEAMASMVAAYRSRSEVAEQALEEMKKDTLEHSAAEQEVYAKAVANLASTIERRAGEALQSLQQKRAGRSTASVPTISIDENDVALPPPPDPQLTAQESAALVESLNAMVRAVAAEKATLELRLSKSETRAAAADALATMRTEELVQKQAIQDELQRENKKLSKQLSNKPTSYTGFANSPEAMKMFLEKEQLRIQLETLEEKFQEERAALEERVRTLTNQKMEARAQSLEKHRMTEREIEKMTVSVEDERARYMSATDVDVGEAEERLAEARATRASKAAQLRTIAEELETSAVAASEGDTTVDVDEQDSVAVVAAGLAEVAAAIERENGDAPEEELDVSQKEITEKIEQVLAADAVRKNSVRRAEMESALQEARAARAKENGELRRLRRILDNRRASEKMLQEKLESLATELSDYKRQVAVARQEADEPRAHVTLLQGEGDNMRSTITVLKQQADRLRDEKKVLEGKLRESEAKMARVFDNNDESFEIFVPQAGRDASRPIMILQEKLKDARVKTRAALERATAAETRVDVLQKQMTDLLASRRAAVAAGASTAGASAAQMAPATAAAAAQPAQPVQSASSANIGPTATAVGPSASTVSINGQAKAGTTGTAPATSVGASASAAVMTNNTSANPLFEGSSSNLGEQRQLAQSMPAVVIETASARSIEGVLAEGMRLQTEIVRLGVALHKALDEAGNSKTKVIELQAESRRLQAERDNLQERVNGLIAAKHSDEITVDKYLEDVSLRHSHSSHRLTALESALGQAAEQRGALRLEAILERDRGTRLMMAQHRNQIENLTHQWEATIKEMANSMKVDPDLKAVFERAMEEQLKLYKLNADREREAAAHELASVQRQSEATLSAVVSRIASHIEVVHHQVQHCRDGVAARLAVFNLTPAEAFVDSPYDTLIHVGVDQLEERVRGMATEDTRALEKVYDLVMAMQEAFLHRCKALDAERSVAHQRAADAATQVATLANRVAELEQRAVEPAAATTLAVQPELLLDMTKSSEMLVSTVHAQMDDMRKEMKRMERQRTQLARELAEATEQRVAMAVAARDVSATLATMPIAGGATKAAAEQTRTITEQARTIAHHEKTIARLQRELAEQTPPPIKASPAAVAELSPVVTMNRSPMPEAARTALAHELARTRKILDETRKELAARKMLTQHTETTMAPFIARDDALRTQQAETLFGRLQTSVRADRARALVQASAPEADPKVAAVLHRMDGQRSRALLRWEQRRDAIIDARRRNLEGAMQAAEILFDPVVFDEVRQRHPSKGQRNDLRPRGFQLGNWSAEARRLQPRLQSDPIDGITGRRITSGNTSPTTWQTAQAMRSPNSNLNANSPLPAISARSPSASDLLSPLSPSTRGPAPGGDLNLVTGMSVGVPVVTPASGPILTPLLSNSTWQPGRSVVASDPSEFVRPPALDVPGEVLGATAAGSPFGSQPLVRRARENREA